MTDVRLYQTPDGGEIALFNGQVVLDDGLSSAVYLSLFGGNEDDSGLDGALAKSWWANNLQSDKQLVLHSETQHLLRSIPAIPASLQRIEDAVTRDLAWVVDDLSATVEAHATMPALNRVAIAVSITIDGTKTDFVFKEPWNLAQ
jgi:phage gp46-like protein